MILRRFYTRRRIHFISENAFCCDICLLFENRLFANSSQKGAPLFDLARHTNSTQRIPQHDCKNGGGVVAEIFSAIWI